MQNKIIFEKIITQIDLTKRTHIAVYSDYDLYAIKEILTGLFPSNQIFTIDQDMSLVQREQEALKYSKSREPSVFLSTINVSLSGFRLANTDHIITYKLLPSGPEAYQLCARSIYGYNKIPSIHFLN